MQKYEVLIDGSGFGNPFPIAVAMDMPIAVLMPELVRTLHLPEKDLFGKPLVYVLRHATSGRILPNNQSLRAAGILPGMHLTLDSSITENVPVPPVPLASTELEPAQAALVTPLASTVTVLSSPSSPFQLNKDLHASDTLSDAASFATFPATEDVQALSTKKQGEVSRRTFLLSFGALCGIGGIGLAYAAYRSLLPVGTALPVHTAPAPTTRPVVQRAVVARARLTFTKHAQFVRTVVWSPDGTLLASGAEDAHVFLWNQNGVVQHDLQLPGGVHGLAMSPDGTHLATGANTQVAFWDTHTGRRVAHSNHRHTQAVNGVAWATQNAQQIVSVGADERAIVWEPQHYQAQLTYKRQATPLTAVSWSPDGQTVATSSQDGMVHVWKAATGQDNHGFYQDSQFATRALAFAPGGMQLATGSDDGIVRLWNGLRCINDGMQCMDAPQRLQISKAAIRALSWSPDARFLAVGTNDGRLVLLQTTLQMKQVFAQNLGEIVRSIVWSPDGKQLATGSGSKVTLWDIM
ncbi:EsaB/YukD family protein [Dictyobacter arantiisoli]|uniref:Uncharacterized protein n=1 Tax=Dictyobacter arantiisoli TaxID=2014874 RepID=A0A5A5T992_9CHLR|nr:EsaB/YukD family protein [Dictyobacter arantiisoli]GCF07835.1 hypothetical protein KDI_13990 [Dictyobacter arantiisoli]